ncbi:hypothetical protein L226DRAFT_568158 [Lentinus tigrinus ALCF2SS1-7]|uniref:uncharacterized protein n=1 Tax=Lentinus tigrinus ALCF2SS1-7 TaxID=1328758 RepID=UPI0011661E1C|nr:hypothetical protein L226DRAFT_568158 [Lentinus tigrinus ALCF2SS1-7]
MPPCLPGELTDKIISLVPNGSEHSDHNTLLNCALVCQEWLPASRMALLQYIRLDSKAAYDSFVQHVLRSERIAHCLDSTHVLWIHEPPRVVESGNRGLPWSQRFIHDFAGHFLNLQKLSVWNVDWLSSGYMAFLMAVAPVLTNLDVGLSVSSLCDVPFSELRNLQVLELGLTWSKASYWNDLSRLLPEIPSQLHAVAFSMFIARGELDKEADELLSETPIKNYEMELLDDVLQGDNFQNLGRVEFRLFDRGYSDTTQCAEVEACVLEMEYVIFLMHV